MLRCGTFECTKWRKEERRKPKRSPIYIVLRVPTCGQDFLAMRHLIFGKRKFDFDKATPIFTGGDITFWKECIVLYKRQRNEGRWGRGRLVYWYLGMAGNQPFRACKRFCIISSSGPSSSSDSSIVTWFFSNAGPTGPASPSSPSVI